MKQKIFISILALILFCTTTSYSMHTGYDADNEWSDTDSHTKKSMSSDDTAQPTTQRNEKCLDRLWRFIFRNILGYGYNSHRVNTIANRSGLIDTLEPLIHYCREHHITTLINLRGAQEEQWWYQLLRQAAEETNIELVDITFDSHHPPTVSEFRNLFRILKDAHQDLFLQRNRLLFMDKEGANRTGLAAALCVFLVLVLSGRDDQATILEKMDEQFSCWRHFYIRYYHARRPKSCMNFAQHFAQCYFSFVYEYRESAEQENDPETYLKQHVVHPEYLEYAKAAYNVIYTEYS